MNTPSHPDRFFVKVCDLAPIGPIAAIVSTRSNNFPANSLGEVIEVVRADCLAALVAEQRNAYKAGYDRCLADIKLAHPAEAQRPEQAAQVTRYGLNQYGSLFERQNGEWVRWEDVAPMLAARPQPSQQAQAVTVTDAMVITALTKFYNDTGWDAEDDANYRKDMRAALEAALSSAPVGATGAASAGDGPPLDALTQLVMCADPWPLKIPRNVATDWLDREAQRKGYADWLDAYHRLWPQHGDRRCEVQTQ